MRLSLIILKDVFFLFFVRKVGEINGDRDVLNVILNKKLRRGGKWVWRYGENVRVIVSCFKLVDVILIMGLVIVLLRVFVWVNINSSKDDIYFVEVF